MYGDYTEMRARADASRHYLDRHRPSPRRKVEYGARRIINMFLLLAIVIFVMTP